MPSGAIFVERKNTLLSHTGHDGAPVQTEDLPYLSEVVVQFKYIYRVMLEVTG